VSEIDASIIITNYNYENYIERAVNSAISQAYDLNLMEVIVVDDGSTDKSLELLKKHSKHINLIHQEHKGLSSAINIAIKNSKGKYIMRLDADDVLDDKALYETVPLLDKNNQIGYVYFDYAIVYEKSDKQVRISLEDFNLFKMVGTNILIRKECFEKIGYYEDMYFEEYDLYFRLFKKYKGLYVNKSLFKYYKHGKSLTDKEKEWKNGLKQLINKYGPAILGNVKKQFPQYSFPFDIEWIYEKN